MSESTLESPSRTYRALEWDKLKLALAHHCRCAWSREIALTCEPHKESTLVEALLDETQEAKSMIEANASLSFENLPDLRNVLPRLLAGASLAAQELLQIRQVLVVARKTKQGISLLNRADFPQISKFLESLYALEPIASEIERCIDDAGEVKNEASSELSRLRREVRLIDQRIKDELAHIMQSSTLSKALQEPIYTQRSGRYVLPVQASSRSIIAGIVHDSSASGLTIYVEPMAVVELANNLRLKESEIEREISRILSELSAQAKEHGSEIETSFRTLIELDFIFARASFAIQYKGVRPEISAQENFNLRQARHPLLVLQAAAGQHKVVANDIVFGGDARTMVVTGPNTGGKTVLLKTAGLLSLMLRAGMLLPVESGSQATIFTAIFADIGDEQSLEQSLSTFSSHMTNIVEIVNNAGKKSLVLLDEIGAGTDPKEGQALAKAILEHLTNSGALTISTTHYGELKSLAYEEKHYLNASFEFDDSTLSPTYKLRIGIPGSSKATTIARRLGLKESVVAQTESYLQSQETDLQKSIEQLEQKHSQLLELESNLQVSLEKSKSEAEESLRRSQELQEREAKLQRDYAGKLEDEYKFSRDTLRRIIAELQKAPSLQKAQQAREELEALNQELKRSEEKTSAGVPALAVGQSVKIVSLRQQGVVEVLPDDASKNPQAQVTVRVGGLRLKVALRELEVLPAGAKKNVGADARQQGVGAGSARPFSKKRSHSEDLYDAPSFIPGEATFVRTDLNTLDMRGERVDAGVRRLEEFLDQGVLRDISPMMIIHGHGTGALKAAVREYLTNSKYVKNFRPGELYEGGDGVTIVEIA